MSFPTEVAKLREYGYGFTEALCLITGKILNIIDQFRELRKKAQEKVLMVIWAPELQVYLKLLLNSGLLVA